MQMRSIINAKRIMLRRLSEPFFSFTLELNEWADQHTIVLCYASHRITALIYCLTCVCKKGRIKKEEGTAHHQVKTKNSLKLNKDDFSFSHIISWVAKFMLNRVYVTSDNIKSMSPLTCRVHLNYTKTKIRLNNKLQFVHFQYLVNIFSDYDLQWSSDPPYWSSTIWKLQHETRKQIF